MKERINDRKSTGHNNVYNSLRLLNTYDKKIVNLNADFFNEKSKPIFRNEIIIQTRCV